MIEEPPAHLLLTPREQLGDNTESESLLQPDDRPCSPILAIEGRVLNLQKVEDGRGVASRETVSRHLRRVLSAFIGFPRKAGEGPSAKRRRLRGRIEPGQSTRQWRQGLGAVDERSRSWRGSTSTPMKAAGCRFVGHRPVTGG